jgi:hypothetical protein
MYEHETVEHRESFRIAWMLLPRSEQRTKSLLSRHVATKRETWVRERVRHIEDFFMAGQVAFNLRVPYSTGHTLEE